MMDVENTSDPLVVLRASGRVDKQEWEKATAAVEEALDRHESIAVFVDITQVETFTAGAALEDVIFSLKNITSVDRITRVAVVSGGGWIASLTEMMEKLVPALDTQIFQPEQESAARQWAADSSE